MLGKLPGSGSKVVWERNRQPQCSRALLVGEIGR